MENLNNKKLMKAKLKVEELKEFYKHIVTYVLVNLFLTFIWKFSFKLFGNFIISNQFDNGNFTHIPIWLIWGVFLMLHAFKTFDFLNLFGRDWEERKIDKFMKE
ncbi:2TM domain-containing protein [Polaribacter sp. MSW13]|uniref:2TM domain-containing protein n=1 Tax=Polaribacter marinus TaxID=2916838 RepID=A0A9X1VR52_9FLAO|nr:2TM domain-containing protein [Polaribacter marinus]MCI2227956.1 2TM domain-containing protein [Polaribacter marinus]